MNSFDQSGTKMKLATLKDELLPTPLRLVYNKLHLEFTFTATIFYGLPQNDQKSLHFSSFSNLSTINRCFD